ncbi:major facilitator superfamily domain-containing protein [Truncatella angustata]|uniref:Major facilitator superfamily domain-containing protein n=1 Tax=Truncatella angustata TaxID=152316 RepID=A0A9P8UZE8_9PEZI|nr:major facilitator superfamily domain-containing protein [Truncatella angustata]KAH6661198.1 major facilitator superfamily domain-containing protein [Truncatella angustata]
MAHRLSSSYFAPSDYKASKHASLDVPGSVFMISSAGNVLRLPIPSKSPRDPLAWSWARRIAAFCSLEFYSVVASFLVNIPGTLMPAFQSEFGTENTAPFSVAALPSTMTLFMAVGYLVNIPLSTAIGRRPVVIMSAAIAAASTLWAGFAGSFAQLLVAFALQGFAVAGAISMCLTMVLDATFIHERPYALSLYWCVGSVIIKALTLPLPLITEITTDWRPIYEIWFLVILIALVLVICFVPETYFIRPPVAFDGRVLVQSGTEKVRIYDDWFLVHETGGMKPLPEAPLRSAWFDQLKIRRAEGTQWWSMLATFAQMPFCFINPLIFWVSLLNACLLGTVIFLNLLQPGALMGFVGIGNSGLINTYLGVSGAIGALLALPLSGPTTAWLTKYLSLRSGGVRHAEVYLPGFAIPTIAGCLSVGMAAVAVDREWSPLWQYVAATLSMISYNTGNVATALWVTEAFPRWASAALSSVLFTANAVAFILGLKLTPWVRGVHIMPQSYVWMGLLAVMGLVAVPVAFWGRTVRQYIQGRWSFSEKGALRPQ